MKEQFWFLTDGFTIFPEYHVSYVCRLMIRVIMKCTRELGTDLLEFILWLRKTSARRLSDEEYATSYRLEWGPVPPNMFSMIAQHVREKGKKVRRE